MNLTDKQYNRFLDLVFNYLSKRDLCACSLVNKTWSQRAMSKLWYQPEFDNGDLTSFQSFQNFFKILTKIASEQTKTLIQIIDINQVKESLYETLNDNWLTLIIQHCPNLRSLIIRDSSCLTPMTIRKLITNFKSTHNSLQYLNLENSKNITENLLKSFIQKFPELLAINLNNCSGVSDSSISQISYICHDLNTIELSNSSSRITDVSFYAISKFGKNKLRKLNFSSMPKFTDNSIKSISNHCKNLEVVNFSSCQLITSIGLANLLMANKNTLKELWIHNMKGIPWLTKDLWELITIKCSKLELLSINFNTITSSSNCSSSFTVDLILYYFSQFKKLKKLVLYNTSEESSSKFLQNLIESFGMGDNKSTHSIKSNKIILEEILIYRMRYECDFILGGYAETKNSMESYGIEKKDVINDEWLAYVKTIELSQTQLKIEKIEVEPSEIFILPSNLTQLLSQTQLKN
ncbi:9730_t:CDS:2 [Diversispora eburnea]|uniref:9730_t:CDS:1 n=1 Tax=Diversispora eburnea TaxID=1213867 RepID=A0A9N9FI12_9GLOM|nr:9730_t:CDS:2 [Diversispora eburnea]